MSPTLHATGENALPKKKKRRRNMSFLAQTNNILVQKLRLVNDFPLLFPQTQIPPFLIILAKIEHSKGLRRNDRNKTRLKLEQNTFKIQSNLNLDAKLFRFKFIFLI